jgi:4-hydroxy-2-oxoglutarate aldolase
MPLARAIGPVHGVPGLKAALEIVGLTGGVPRAPLRPVAAAARESLRSLLEPLGLVKETHASSH